MARYIDIANQRYTEGWNDCMMRIKSMVSKAPTVDVVLLTHGYKWAFICSRCGYIDSHPFDDRHNLCPNCGARMESDK